MTLSRQLPPGWTWVTVGDLAAPEARAITDGPFGSNLKTSHYVDRGPRVVRLQNIGEGHFVAADAHITLEHYESLIRHDVREGDLVIAALGERLPRACVIPSTLGPAIVKADCIRVRLDSRLALASFVNWMLNAEPTRARTASVVHGVGRPRLNLAEVKAVTLPLPPLAEQRRIVSALEEQFTRLDAAIASLKRAQANLTRYHASVLNAAIQGRLFSDGSDALVEDPTSCRGDRRADYARRRAVPADGWKWVTIGDIGQIQGGIQKQPKRDPRENSFPFLRVANVLRGRLNLSEVHRIELFPGELERLRLRRDDLLIVEGNGSPREIGRMARWDGSIHDCVHQNHLIRVRVSGDVSPRYVEVYWNSPQGSADILSLASSTSGLYTLSVAKVRGSAILIPPLDEQHRIVAEVERRLSAIEAMETSVIASLKRAARLRQSILKRAFEGRLVPQDPTDEPSAVLLERIRAERAGSLTHPRARPNRRPTTPLQEPLPV